MSGVDTYCKPCCGEGYVWEDDPCGYCDGTGVVRSRPRMLYTCNTAGCECAGAGFTDESGFCSICLQDLAGIYDTTGTLLTDEERRDLA